MQYLSVANLEKFQHYTNRNPPWVKLHQCILDDYEFSFLPDTVKWVAVGCILLASRYENRIPYDAEWIKGELKCRELPDLKPLIEIGWIILLTPSESTVGQDDSAALPSSDSEMLHPPRSQESEPEGETETECEFPAREAEHLPNLDSFMEDGSDVEGWQRVLRSRLKGILGIDLAIFQTERLLDGFFREFDEKELKTAIPAVLKNIVKRKPTNPMAYLKALARDGGLKEFAKSEPVGVKPADDMATLGRNEDELSDEDSSAEAERFRAMVHERVERARF